VLATTDQSARNPGQVTATSPTVQNDTRNIPVLTPQAKAEQTLGHLAGQTRRISRQTLSAASAGLNVLIAAAVVAILFSVVRQVHLPTEIDGSTILPVPVRLAKPIDGFSVMERFSGRIEARRQTPMAFDQGGRVVKVFADQGDAIAAGDLLAKLDDRVLQAERRRILAQRDGIDFQIEQAQLNLDRTVSLVERGVASEQSNDNARIQLRQLQASRREVDAALAALVLELEKTNLFAPFAGQITERSLNDGAIVVPGSPVLALIETVAPRLKVGLPEERARRLSEAQRVRVTYRGETIEARVLSIRPDLDPSTQSVLVLIELALSEAHEIRIGDTADVWLETLVPGPGFAVPLTALVEGRRGLWMIYVVDDTGVVGIEALEVVAITGDTAFVQGSLRPGQYFVTQGRHRIAPGQIVQPQVAPEAGE
jgi:RND family efflux transporter MFP subunit